MFPVQVTHHVACHTAEVADGPMLRGQNINGPITKDHEIATNRCGAYDYSERLQANIHAREVVEGRDVLRSLMAAVWSM